MFIRRVNLEDVKGVRDIATASGHSNWVKDMLAATPERWRLPSPWPLLRRSRVTAGTRQSKLVLFEAIR